MARRRDEVIRRMANTPPQPRTSVLRRRKTGRKAVAGRAADKSLEFEIRSEVSVRADDVALASALIGERFFLLKEELLSNEIQIEPPQLKKQGAEHEIESSPVRA